MATAVNCTQVGSPVFMNTGVMEQMKTYKHRLAVVAGALALTQVVSAQTVKKPAADVGNGVAAYDLWVEPPTLKSIGLEWRIKGDDNRNAAVAVDYREVGSSAWHKALPLVRSQGERVGNLVPPRPDFHPDPNNYTNPNMFAGSILDLEPGTAYEVRLTLSDPDGVKGKKLKPSRCVPVRNPCLQPAARSIMSTPSAGPARNRSLHSLA